MIATPSLHLRRWRDEDRAPFAAINADKEVGGWLAGPFSPEESDAQIDSSRRTPTSTTSPFGPWRIGMAYSDGVYSTLHA